MKSQSLRVFTILGTLFLAAVAANAQSPRSQVTSIPFDFVVGQKSLPAGEYVVKPNRRNSDSAWLVQSKDGHDTVLISTRSVQASKTQKKTKLVFNKYGDKYFLSQIWTDGSDSGREVIRRKQERELEKVMIAQRTIVLPDATTAQE
jgi:hypothetical protein